MAKKRQDIIEGDGGADSYAGYPGWLKDRLEWFQDLKFGFFIHWGIYSQWGCIESWPLVEADMWARPDDLQCWLERDKNLARFRRDYRALNKSFNPTQFDPESWANAAEYAGMKYVAFTTKHHDGFCMFDTKTTDYRVTHPDCPFHTNPRANIAKEVFDAFRKRDFGVSCYFSKSDWHTPYYWDPERPAPDRNPNYDTHAEPARWEKFVRFVHAQIRELMSENGRMDVLWLDGGQVRPPDQDIRMAEMAAMAREYQPGLIVADRTVGGPYENILTPEQQIPDAPLEHPWESCLTMGNGWSYRPRDEYKSARKLIHMLIDIVAKGGNLLLNVGPSPEGALDPNALERMRDIGDWMAVNSEAIHGTRPIAPYKEGNVCFTQKAGYVYAIVLPENDTGKPPVKINLRELTPAVGADVFMLGIDKPLDWQPTDSGAEINMETTKLPCNHAWTIKFQTQAHNA